MLAADEAQLLLQARAPQPHSSWQVGGAQQACAHAEELQKEAAGAVHLHQATFARALRRLEPLDGWRNLAADIPKLLDGEVAARGVGNQGGGGVLLELALLPQAPKKPL